jgi:hypothetical protein
MCLNALSNAHIASKKEPEICCVNLTCEIPIRVQDGNDIWRNQLDFRRHKWETGSKTEDNGTGLQPVKTGTDV